MTTATCSRCGGTYGIGDYPFCKGNRTDHQRGTTHVIGDEIDETHLDLDPHGGVVRFRSRSEKARYLAARGLEPFVRHVPLPGSDKSPHTINWAAYPDAVTLENARILVARQAEKPTARELRVTLKTFKDVSRVVTLQEIQDDHADSRT